MRNGEVGHNFVCETERRLLAPKKVTGAGAFALCAIRLVKLTPGFHRYSRGLRSVFKKPANRKDCSTLHKLHFANDKPSLKILLLSDPKIINLLHLSWKLKCSQGMKNVWSISPTFQAQKLQALIVSTRICKKTSS
jgi:hypothetical protein